MIKIYAFCGMEKTTLSNKHGYVDEILTHTPYKDILGEVSELLLNVLILYISRYYLM